MIMASSPFVRAGSLFYPEPLREGTVFIEKVVYAEWRVPKEGIFLRLERLGRIYVGEGPPL